MTESIGIAKILIVEDEVLIAADLASRLKKLGYTICGQAASGEKALELVEKQQPDLVMMDIVLQGGMDGIDAAEVIWDKLGTPVVFLTAHADTGRLERAKLTYPFGYLLKPFQDRDLKITVDMALYVAKVDAERRKANRIILESEKEYRSLFDNMLNGFAYCQMLYLNGKPDNFVFFKVNKAFGDLTGLKNVVGKKVTEVIPRIKEETPELFEIYGRVADGGEPEQFEIDFTPLSIWLNISVYSPQKGYFVAVFENISDKKDAERKLIKEKEIQAAIIDNIPVMITRYDPNANMLYLNKEFEKQVGWTTEDVRNIDMMSKVYPDPEYRREALAYMQNASVDWKEFRVQAKSGKIVESEWSNIRLDDGTRIGIGIDITERKQAEEDLRNSEEKYRTLFENMMHEVHFWKLVRDEHGAIRTWKLVDVNPAGLKSWGKTKSEIIGKTTDEIFSYEATKHFLPTVEKIFSEGAPQTWESYFPATDQVLHMTSVPLGEYFISTGTDITDRKKAENSLKSQKDRFGFILKGTNVGTWEWNIQTGETIFNERWAEMIGYSLEEISPTSIETWMKFSHPEDLQAGNKALLRHFNGETDYYDMECRMKHKEGDWVWFLDRGKVISWTDEGKPLWMYGTHQDITERKRAEELIWKSEYRSRTILHTAMDGFWMITVDGRFLEVNEAYCRMSGYSEQELLGMSISDMEANEASEEITSHMEKIVENGQDRFETKHRRKDGSLFDVEISVQYLRDRTDRAVAFLRDISERKRYEEALRKSVKDLRESQRIAHVGSWRLDIATNEVFWTDELYKMYGFDPTLPPPAFTEHMKLFTPESWEQLSVALARTVDTGVPYELELETVKEDGSNGWMWVRGEAVENEEREIIGLWGAAQDITERKLHEESLKASEERFKTLSEESPLGISLIDDSGRYKYINPTFTSIFGYSLDDIETGVDWFKMAFPDEDYRKEVIRCWKKDLLDYPIGKSRPRIFDVTCKDGSVKTIYFRPVTTTSYGQFIIYEDMTEKKQAEEERRRIEHKYETLFREMLDGFALHEIICDEKGNPINYRFLAVNPAFERMTGLKSGYVTGRTVLDVLPETEPYWVETYGRVALTGEPVFFENYSGEIGKYLEVTAFCPSQGQFACIFQDITERRKAENALKAREEELEKVNERFKLATDSARIGVWDLNLKTNALVWDDWMYYLYGVDPDHFGGAYEAWKQGLHPDDIVRMEEEVQRAIRGENEFDTEFRVVLPSGRIRHIKAFAKVHKDETGEPARLTGINFDITARKLAEGEKEKLQSQLQQAQKMEAIGTLAGGISHDFNNLLQAINGYTQLLLMEKNDTDPEYNSLKAIQDAGFRASELVRRLLLFSRKADSTRKPIELQYQVAQAKKMLERTIPKMVRIQVLTGTRLWKINADQVQIEQMLLNLGTNAADAMPDGGKLLFEIENRTLDDDDIGGHMGVQPGRYVLLTVSDTGHGMDKATLEKIFEPFFTTKAFGKGTGLGLASVYGLVKSHGGYITCYSEVGQGTTFKIYFPAIVQPEIEENTEIEPRPIPRGTETILLVDDEEAIRGFAQDALIKFGYAVLTASTGEEALECFAENSAEIDLVVMDLGMPGMGGHKCLQELLKVNPAVKVVIASGYSISGQVKQSMEAGARGYVGKPYQLADLLNMVRMVLDEIQA